MKKLVLSLSLMLVGVIALCSPVPAGAYEFGDFRSATLVGKAWSALGSGDIEAVLAYTNKCLELYGEQARAMQKDLKEFVVGEPKEVHAKWALNDVATSLYIQGEAYRKANMKDEAKEAYKSIVDNYGFGQTWDPKGWFWKPADAAKEKLAMLESGVELDFGDYTSSAMITKAWGALTANDIDQVLAYVNKTIELYAKKAQEMQASLTEYPWESKDKIFSYWALNDVGTGYFILGEAYRNAGKNEEAKAAYKELIDKYSYSQCWDPQGWFWKPAEAAQEKVALLESSN
ncbi:MAG: tetratricopeptide repeat protein [Candidatus Omnitrophica bacterium]|nr:tetratricopeptide repeat protein [Candidatus Omnitrophota bacterium]